MRTIKNYVGKILYGYCDGFFGRDSYSDKVVESQGKDWIVARTSDLYNENFPIFCSFLGWEDSMERLLDEWIIKH